MSNPILNEDSLKPTARRAAKLKEAKRVWALRAKFEKNGVYHIPRPDPFTPVPEETLQRLNEILDCSELELKLYYTCCRYQDEVNYRKLQYKPISYELIKDTFEIKHTGSDINRTIHRSLCYLKVIGLIDFEEYFIANRRGKKIPCFKLKNVWKYIDYKIKEVKDSELLTNEEFKELCSRLPNEEINIDFS